VFGRLAEGFALVVLIAQVSAAQTYFPPGIPEDTSGYELVLKALREPSLWELSRQNPSAEAYRFLYLRERDRPASIRLVVGKSGSTGWFYRRMSSGQGDQPGGIREYGMSWSWKSRTAAFLSIVEDEGFWNLATLAGPVSGCRSHWIIEGVKQGRYHLVDRCSPDPADPVRVIASRAMKWGNLRISRSRIY
jgi:hypothetical protein